MAKISDILTSAAAVRNETAAEQNSALRVGNVLYSLAQYLQQYTSIADIKMEVSDVGVRITARSQTGDTTLYDKTIALPVANNEQAGILTAEAFSKIKADIAELQEAFTDLFNEKEELVTRVNANSENIATLDSSLQASQRAIANLNSTIDAAKTEIADNAGKISDISTLLDDTKEIADTATRILPFDGVVSNPIIEEMQGTPYYDSIVFDSTRGLFLSKKAGKYYNAFPGAEHYNKNMKARTDRLYRHTGTQFVYYYDGTALAPFIFSESDREELEKVAQVQELATEAKTDAARAQETAEATKSELESGVIYDVSTHNNGAVFESLQSLLSSSNLDTLIPTSVRHGGMSIRFVQSSDNKYVQARCMAQNFTTDVTQWQGVDDEPTAKSNNLVKSVGIYNSISPINSILAELNLPYKTTLTLSQNKQDNAYIPFTLYKDITYNVAITADINDENTYCYLVDAVNNSSLLTFTINAGEISKTVTYTPTDNITNIKIAAQSSEAKTLNIEISVENNIANQIANLQTQQSIINNNIKDNNIIVGIDKLSRNIVDWEQYTLYKGIIASEHESQTNYNEGIYYGNSYQLPVTGCSYVLVKAGSKEAQYAFLRKEMTYPYSVSYDIMLSDGIYCKGVDGYSTIPANDILLLKVPSDANFIYIRNKSANPNQHSVLPQEVTIYTGVDRLLALENQYNGIGSKISDKLKSFEELYKPQLNWVANALEGNGRWSKNFRFIKVSDIHGNFINMDNAKNIQNFFNRTTIPTFVTGDICYGNPKGNGVVSTEVATYVEKAKACNAYLCAGQHECGFSNLGVGIDGTKKDNTFTHQEFVDYFITPMLSTWNLPEGEGTNPYYYQDFDTVRLISLYQFNIPLVDDPNDSTRWKYPRERVWYGQEQLDWFAGVLNSTPSTHKVIVMMHCPDGRITLINNRFNVVDEVSTVDLIIDGSPIFDIVEAFVNKTTINRRYICSDTTQFSTDTFHLDVNYDFTSSEGSFMCYLGGDFHVDYIGKPQGKQQLYISMASGLTPFDTVLNNKKDNVQYNCIVDCCGVNFTEKSVYIARLGQTASALGTDRSFDVVKY